VKYPKMTIDKCAGIEIGRRYFKAGNVVYNVGDVIKGMRFFTSEKEYFEADVKLTSTNVRGKSASFRGIGELLHKKKGEKP
jgi:hypothetical protein